MNAQPPVPREYPTSLDSVAHDLQVVLSVADLESSCVALLNIGMHLLSASGARVVLRPQPVSSSPAVDCSIGNHAHLPPPSTSVVSTAETASGPDDVGPRIVSIPKRERNAHHLSTELRSGDLLLGEIAVGRIGNPFSVTEANIAQLLGSVVLQQLERQHDAAQLATERNHFKRLVEQIPAAVFLAQPDSSGTNVYMSPQIDHILGYTSEEMQQDTDLWLRVIHPDDRERVLQTHLDWNVTGEAWDIEYRAIHRQGHVVWIHENAVLLRNDDDSPMYWQGVLTDITRRRQAEEDVRLRDTELRAVLESISDPFYAMDNEWRITYLNDAMSERLERLYKVPRGNIIGRTFIDVIPNLRNSVLEHRLRQAKRDRTMADFEVFLSPHKQWISVRAYPSETGIAVYVRDISAQRRMEARLTHQAFHDQLTGLPNQTLLRHRIELALQQAGTMHRHVAVLMIDINRFRVVNDSLGHAVGDELLVALSQRMLNCIRSDDTVARFGGDAFVILLPAVDSVDDATEVADRLLQAVVPSFTLTRRSIQSSVSIGIALNDCTDSGPDDLLRRADLALHRAKSTGTNSYAVFGRELHEAVMRRLDLEGELREAVEENQLSLLWQPMFDLRSGQVRRFEALTRWMHPERGEVPPTEFIPLAEDTGIIVALGRQMLLNACRQAVAWGRRLSTSYPTIAVNISSREFREPDLVSAVANTLQVTGLSPRQLILEITESLLMDDVDDSLERLSALKQLGIGLAIDDFGTGYSSLAYLHRFPVDVLKIDRRFIVTLGQGEQNRIIAGAAINLAHALGIVTVGEGVETQEQLQHLRALGADMAQGFYLSRPVSGTAILQRHRLPDADTIGK